MQHHARPLLVVVAATLVASCATTHRLAIRPIASRFATAAPVSVRVGEGLGHLALGDAGLALESFRRALAEDPANVAAMRGIAAAYDVMGRADLSRPMYERALAAAPRDTVTLTALASSLAKQGLDREATLVRREVAQVGSDPVPATSVTVALEPARPASVAIAEPVVIAQSGPRLERLSMGEVALVTLPASLALPRPALAMQRFASVATIRPPRSGPVGIRVLNATRQNGLAANTRLWLEQRGWRRIAIGNAPAATSTSHVLYPAVREQAGRRLAAQFGFVARRGPLSQEGIIVVLGQNALVSRARTIRG